MKAFGKDDEGMAGAAQANLHAPTGHVQKSVFSLMAAHVKTLRLRIDAPWPSEILARKNYRMRALCRVRGRITPP